MSESEILARMPSAKGWDRLGDMLARTWRFSASRRALEFVIQATAVAEKFDHYPDIILRFRDVRVELSTHAEGGLTPCDFAVAAELNTLPTDRSGDLNV